MNELLTQMDRLLTQNEVAALLQIGRPILLSLVRDGKIKSVTIGKRRRFRRVDIESYLEKEGE